jgi:curved DNA-binding protein CbpA
MFVDYYFVLEISDNSTTSEIKSAYKRLAKKYHPDRNNEADSTKKMQLINEAFSILEKQEDRARYHAEYLRYKEFTRKKDEIIVSERPAQANSRNSQAANTRNSYSFKDEFLRTQMERAREKAAEKKEKIWKTLMSFLGSICCISITVFLGPNPVFIFGSIMFPILTVLWLRKYIEHK